MVYMKMTHDITLHNIDVTGEVTYKEVDASFDHEFGTEHRSEWEADYVDLLEANDLDGNNIPLWCLSDEFKKQAVELLKMEKV